jgi:DNA-binding protein HU-beta
MNQADLVKAVATALDLNRSQAEGTVAAVLASIATALGNGEEVRLNTLGIFEVVARAARPGRNPKTGESIEIAASRSVKFKPAKALRDTLNPSGAEDEP